MSALRMTIRGLVNTPIFTLIAVISLALGIGANTAIFSLLDRVLLQTLSVKNPGGLVLLYHPGPTQGHYSVDEPPGEGPSFSYPMFRDLQREQTPFTGIAGARDMSVSLSYRNQPSAGGARLVSGNYFDLLGVAPAIGRVISENDDRAPGASPVAVLGYGYWTSQFGNDPGVLNQTILVNGFPMTIIGVAAKGFTSEKFGDTPDLFVPITMKQAITPDWSAFDLRTDYWITLFARLKPGVTAQRAAVEINAAYRVELEKDIAVFKDLPADFLPRYRAKTIILKLGEYGRSTLRDYGRLPLFLMMAMATLVLLIACANVANLQMARVAARQREIGVRLALGATRRGLIARFLTESSTLAIAGGALGLCTAYATIHLIAANTPVGSEFSGALSSRLDWRVLVFTFALSLLSGVLFGIFPALRATDLNITVSLKTQSGQATVHPAANLFRKSLTTLQMAISLVLLIAAGLLGTTLVNLTHIDLGIRSDHLLTFSMAPKLNKYTDQRALQFYDQLTERLRAIPGVRLASAAQIPVVGGDDSAANITVEGYTPRTDEDADVYRDRIGPDYFRTLGIPLIAGRELAVDDDAAAPKVAVVNESFVRHFLAGQNPLGARLALGGGRNIKLNIEIVGVVKDAKYSRMREAPKRVLYLPYRQNAHASLLYFYVRTAVEPQALASVIRREAAALDPNLPLVGVKTMDEQIDQNLYAERLISFLTAAFAGLAMLLAAVGLYGVMAYNVAQRTREIGIRMALGAQAGQVRGMIAREVTLMLAIGTLTGAAAALASGRLVQSILYGLKWWDPWICVSAALTLWIVALLAAWIPARRASRVDPMIALRYE